MNQIEPLVTVSAPALLLEGLVSQHSRGLVTNAEAQTFPVPDPGRYDPAEKQKHQMFHILQTSGVRGRKMVQTVQDVEQKKKERKTYLLDVKPGENTLTQKKTLL